MNCSAPARNAGGAARATPKRTRTSLGNGVLGPAGPWTWAGGGRGGGAGFVRAAGGTPPGPWTWAGAGRGVGADFVRAADGTPPDRRTWYSPAPGRGSPATPGTVPAFR